MKDTIQKEDDNMKLIIITVFYSWFLSLLNYVSDHIYYKQRWELNWIEHVISLIRDSGQGLRAIYRWQWFLDFREMNSQKESMGFTEHATFWLSPRVFHLSCPVLGIRSGKFVSRSLDGFTSFITCDKFDKFQLPFTFKSSSCILLFDAFFCQTCKSKLIWQ